MYFNKMSVQKRRQAENFIITKQLSVFLPSLSVLPLVFSPYHGRSNEKLDSPYTI